MTARPTSVLLVTALIRRVAQAGGAAAVLARGDADAGAILLICAERGEMTQLLELGRDLDGRSLWRPSGEQVVAGTTMLADYLGRRRATDPDLWVVELDIAYSQRFAAEMIGDG